MYGPEGEWQNVNWLREYTNNSCPNTMMDACLGTMFWFIESEELQEVFCTQYRANAKNLQKGIWVMTLNIDGQKLKVVCDDFLPCKENYPLYNK
jgi:hypothetical protein